MKNLILTLIFFVSLFSNVYSQCNTIYTTVNPATTQNAGTSFTSRAGNYFILNVTAGNSYEIKSSLATQNFCIRTGSYNGTIVSQGGMNNAANGLVYVAQTTGQIYVHIYTQACATSTTNRTITVTDISSSFGVANSLPYTQGFNSTLMPNNNWYGYAINMGSGSSTPLRFTGIATGSNPTSTPYEGSNYVRANSYNASSGTSGRFVSPAISTTGTADVSLEFYWGEDNNYSTSNDNVQVQYSTNGNNWTNVGSPYSRYSATAGVNTSWSKKTINLPSGAGNQTKIYIGFLFTSAWGGHMSLDKVTVSQTCTTPTNGGTLISSKTNTTVNDATVLTTSSNEGTITKIEWSFDNFSTVEGYANNPSNPYSIILNVQEPQVWFRSVSENGSCPSGNSNIISISLNDATPYLDGIIDGDYISNVTLNDLNNNSTNDGDSYEDFRYLMANLTKGDTYTLYVTATNTFMSGQGYSAWIDWNGDGLLQTTENVLLSAPANNTSQTITVPSDAVTGDVLMRVLSVWGSTPSNDAYYSTPYDWGEIEEYTIRLSNPVPLPVELQVFDGVNKGYNNYIYWVTASEHNTSHFNIQKSDDGENWTTIITLNAAGNSNTTINYDAVDYGIAPVINYYRLQQYDLDGVYETFGPIAINNMNLAPGKTIYKYINLNGQEIDPDKLAPGTLYIQLYTDGTNEKVVK